MNGDCHQHRDGLVMMILLIPMVAAGSQEEAAMVITTTIMIILHHRSIMTMVQPIIEIGMTTTMIIMIMTIETNGVGITTTSIADDESLDDRLVVMMITTINIRITMIMLMRRGEGPKVERVVGTNDMIVTIEDREVEVMRNDDRR